MKSDKPLVGVVGPCAAGKSTLVGQLRTLGFQAKHIAQEHSYVRDMWFQMTRPDILVYLDVTFETSCERTRSSWTRKIFDNQIARLAHARQHADLYIATDGKTPDEVLRLVVDKIRGIQAK